MDPAIVRALMAGPWAIDLGATTEATARLSLYLDALTRVGPDIEARGAGTTPAADDVAIVPIHGVLLPRAPAWASAFGITSTAQLGAAVAAAADSRNVKAVLLHVDSVGGDVRGIEETADIIHAASTHKPTTAVIEHVGASAAYWLASQAREVVIAPSGYAGSIGVITQRLDITTALERDGIKAHVLTAGPHKGEGHPATPLLDPEREAIESRLQQLYRSFLDGVARGRRIPAGDVESRYGGGRTLIAGEAVRLGLADRVGTLASELARQRASLVPGAKASLADPFIERIRLEAEQLRLTAGV